MYMSLEVYEGTLGVRLVYWVGACRYDVIT